MSLLTDTSIRWGIDPRITSHELTKLNYLFFQISCHSILPISHLHIIPLKRCVFLYALVTDTPISFLSLFISYLVKVHRSSAKSQGLFFPVFIHRILLHLGLEDFPASKHVHIIAPIGATFLRQRVAQMKASSKCPRVESFYRCISTFYIWWPHCWGVCGSYSYCWASCFFIERWFYTEYVGHYHDHSGDTWSTPFGCAHWASGFTSKFGEY